MTINKPLIQMLIAGPGRSPRAFSITVFISAIAAFLMVFSFAARAEEAPQFKSKHGIKVLRSAWLHGSDRTVIVDIETPQIAPRAINGGANQVFITLPKDYSYKSKKRYPALYLLHGGAGGRASQWAIGGGTAEWSTRDLELITVMPDCGKVGWFTDWVDQDSGAQEWETFHLEQLIPWIDYNLRTNPRKKGRAIAGLSMGGYGAFHYAFRRPDLFAYAASFSGAVDLEDSATQLTIYEQSLQNLFPGSGAFGPRDGDNWAEHNPLKHVEDLRTVELAMYVGSGIHMFDLLEGTMNSSAKEMHNALDEAGISHFYWMYGRPGGATGCDGGHNFGCWNFALNDALPKIMSVVSGGKQTATEHEPPGKAEIRDIHGPDILDDLNAIDEADVFWN